MWQPIETAPKDGTWILADNVNYRKPYVVQWRPDADLWEVDDPGRYGTEMDHWEPTHWRPCPRVTDGTSTPQE